MADTPQASKDEELANKLEKFVDRFPSTEDYEAINDYVTAVNDESEEDLNDMRDSVVADLEELKENWEGVKDQIEELLKFVNESFPA